MAVADIVATAPDSRSNSNSKRDTRFEQPMLEARHLVKRFLGIPTVNDVSFAIKSGEVVGYLGPNGSGKSTTAKMLTGLLEASDGAVFFENEDIRRDPVAFRQRLGYVPEEPILYNFQSGTEYLQLVGRLRELNPRLLTRKIDALLELFGLSEAANQELGSYSKGMKQRVMLIAALLHDPDVLILDEPDSGLDVTTTLVLRHLLSALARRGKAVLYSSHILELVEKACSRVIVIHQGRVVADDSVEALQRLVQSASLEEVFSQLVLRDDPQRTAIEIADVVADHA
jgi:ABC-2 type transport system ATP-binding protein